MKAQTEKIRDFLSNLDTEIDVLDYVDPEDVNSYDDVYNQLDEAGGFDVEIIYYGNAMDYLAEHDPSLIDSLEIADEYGYRPEDLNSEVLASILATRRTREDFKNWEPEITKFFDELK